MSPTHDLIAVLPEVRTGPPPAGLTWHAVGDLTAVMAAAPAPLVRLPATRRTQLLAAAEYHRHLETLSAAGPVLPVAQGTAIRAADADALLRANAPLLTDLGHRYRRLDQYQITVSWDAALVLQRFRDTPELAGLFDAGRVAPEAVGAAVARLADRLGATIAAIMGPVARDLIALPVDATTLANVVMLVPQDRTDALDAALCDIDAIWTEGFRIRQTGPAAPCSFATLHPRWISAAHIADAHALLDVTPTSPAQTLNAARKAMLRHGTAEKERIDAAHRIAVAAARVRSARGFHLCDIWRDGSALALPSRQDAA